MTEPIDTKICKKCNEEKPLSLFERLPSGFRGICKKCQSERNTAQTKARRKAEQAATGWVSSRATATDLQRTETTQRCSECRETKVYTDFPLDKTSPVGRGSKCNACRLVYVETLRERNIEEFRKSGRERTAAWRERNRPEWWTPPRQWKIDTTGRECIRCEQYKLWTEFYPDKTLTSGMGSICKSCHRDASLYRRRGITADLFDYLLAEQNGVCFLCEMSETKKHHGSGVLMSLSIDHDHKCCPPDKSCVKCIRGLLCHSCNNYIIGNVEGKPALEIRFADYLVRRPLLVN